MQMKHHQIHHLYQMNLMFLLILHYQMNQSILLTLMNLAIQNYQKNLLNQ